MSNEKALRYNQGKLKWSLVDFKSIEPLVQVLMFGAEKYAPENWKNKMDLNEILDSSQRHHAAMIDGELFDPESGELHAGHIFCNMMFWVYHYRKQLEQAQEEAERNPLPF